MVNSGAIFTVKDFLSEEEVKEFLRFAESNTVWRTGGNVFWKDRVIDLFMIYDIDKDLAIKLNDIKNRVISKVKELYCLDEEIFPDLMQLTRWFPGMTQPPHSDDMRGTDHEENNVHRSFGVVIYLNDNFSGGKTFYPQHDLEVSPVPGMMAVHPSDRNHMHGVTEISGDIRYTLTTFITFDPSKGMFDVIEQNQILQNVNNASV